MPHNSETIKAIIKTFVEENIDSSISIRENFGEHFLANKAIFEIESYLVELRNLYQVNERIDTSITSKNIMDSIDGRNFKNAFTPFNYEYNFLFHLAGNYNKTKSLNTLINSFINEYKEHFTLADIVITASGATRCKTNIRFALNNLRDSGLVISKDKNDKRSWSPSLIGLVVLLNSRFCTLPSPADASKEITLSQYIQKLDNKTFEFADRNQLQFSISQIKQPGYIYNFLTWQNEIALDIEEKKVLDDLLNKFVDFTQDGLKVTENGVIQTDTFNERSKKFHKDLFYVQDNNPVLLSKLFNHFRTKN